MDGTKLLNALLELRARGGDDAGLESRLSQTYKPKLDPKIGRKLRRRPELRGVTSRTSIFASVLIGLRRVKRYEEVRSGTAFFMARVNNSIRNRVRKVFAQKRDPRREDRSDDARRTLAANTHTPLEQDCQQETVIHAEKLFRELPVRDQEVLQLRHAAGLTFPLIGEALDIPTATAYARYLRARGRWDEKVRDNGLEP